MSRRLAVLGATLAATLAAVPAAHASTDDESSFQDDPLLVFGSAGTVDQTLDTLRSLGVDRIRVSLFWRAVAPGGTSKTKPANFDATDPGAYRQTDWYRYDRLIIAAYTRGITVNLNVTDPAPSWATGNPKRADIEPTYNPSVSEFGAFMKAAAIRYSGQYAVPATSALVPPAAKPPGGGGFPIPVPPLPKARAAAVDATQEPAGTILPRVDYWSIWNEPNQPGWLTPQWTATGAHGRYVEAAPRIYRNLLDAAWSALQQTGHGKDTILIGDTAPKGLNVVGTTRAIKAMHFIRLLYCLGDRYHLLRGARATQVGCPPTPRRAAFRAAHPALFEATGWAHHPYELIFSPSIAPKDPDFVTIANLPRLTNGLTRALGAWGRHRRGGGMPLYLTEFGYQTNPPDPTGVTWSQQAAYLDQSEFIAYANPNVRTLSQFLLHDDAPGPGGDYGATFQSGLETNAGAVKPSFSAYRLPIYLPQTTFARRASLRVWGMLRAAPNGKAQQVAVEFRATHGTGWRRLRLLATDGGRGYLDRRVRLPGSGAVRLDWQGTVSRSVGVRRR